MYHLWRASENALVLKKWTYFSEFWERGYSDQNVMRVSMASAYAQR